MAFEIRGWDSCGACPLTPSHAELCTHRFARLQYSSLVWDALSVLTPALFALDAPLLACPWAWPARRRATPDTTLVIVIASCPPATRIGAVFEHTSPSCYKSNWARKQGLYKLLLRYAVAARTKPWRIQPYWERVRECGIHSAPRALEFFPPWCLASRLAALCRILPRHTSARV